MATREATTFCRTTVNYMPGGATTVDVADGRAADLPGWEACGFELLRHQSAITDWTDDDEIRRVHYAEAADLAKRLSGCDHALVSGHIKRNPEEAARHRDLAPITLVHSDFADSYGHKIRGRYRDAGPEEQAALAKGRISGDVVASARRLLILQFWRNIGPPKMDLPLAFCDARTVPRDEIRAFPVTNYAGGGFNFEALAVAAPRRISSHGWYAFPEMTPNEVVAFRTYDTDRIGTDQPYWTPHSAIRDPEVQPGKPSRSSIELRATCLFL